MTTHDAPLTPSLLAALQDAALYDHSVDAFLLLETHISWVLLTGPYAYKIKKPVNLGFLDFSTLEQRRRYCEEELRLNRRLAPDLYLDVVTITGTSQAPRLDGVGSPLEYAVKMQQFSQDALLSSLMTRGAVRPDHMDALAAQLAAFHRNSAPAGDSMPFGTPDMIHGPVLANFEQLSSSPALAALSDRVARVKRWTSAEHARCVPMFAHRKAQGRVRECHGDLHLGNMVLINDAVVVFDCIEFSERLRWIDVMSEVAFVTMDLQDRKAPALAWRLLNRYLELTGDYEGVEVLQYYSTYRAMVRAKVAAIRLGQEAAVGVDDVSLCHKVETYVHLAEGFTRRPAPRLILTRGLSGSGKTTVSQDILESLGAIRVRSDVERQRLWGRAGDDGGDHSAEVYSVHTTDAVYDRLHKLARHLLRSGRTVIVDATFLTRDRRAPFHALARTMGVPFVLLDIDAPIPVLRQRITTRAQAGDDASEATLAVLEAQRRQIDAWSSDEEPSVVRVDTGEDGWLDGVVDRILHVQPSAG